MAITYLGEVAVTHDGSVGGMTVSLTSLSLQQDDVVVVGFLLASNTDRSIGVNTAGYTEEAELFANDTYDANLSVSWKRMGSTPDSSVDVSGPGSSTHPARIIARGYRGVDTTTAMDVARTTATGTNGLLVDPPSITPTTSGALIVAWGCGAANAAALSTAYSSSDLTDFTSGIVSNSYDLAYGVGHKSWTSGAFDAAAWTGTETATTDSRASVVLALRPATASGTSVNLDTLAYTETVNSLTAQVDTPVAFDTLAYSEALPDLTAAVNTPVALDSLGYTASLPDMTLAVPAVVALDSLSYAASLPDVSVSTGTTVALDALSYSASLPDATATVGTPVALDALAYSTALPDVGVAASATVALDTLEYTAALPDVVLSTGTQEQPGGWLPIKYVDRDGNVVDLDDVEEAVEEIAETAPPKRRADLRRISDRVIAALGRQEAPRRDDVRLLRRALAEREAALEALNAAILAQQLLDDEITALLLAA